MHAAWPPPAYGGPNSPYPPAGSYYSVPLNKPGTVALRPLGLGDILDGAFSTMRRNPRATIGMGALVTLAFMTVPILITVIMQASGNLTAILTDPNSVQGATASQFGSFFAVIAAMVLAGSVSTIVVSGLIVPVVNRAALGEKITAGDAWQRARGRLLALIGLSLLGLLLGVVATGVAVFMAYAIGGVGGVLTGGAIGLILVIGLIYVYIRYFLLAAVVVVAERLPISSALARGGRLTRNQWWRIFGIYLLCTIIAGVAGQILAAPFAVVGTIFLSVWPDGIGPFLYLLITNLARVVEGGIVAPFSGCVAVLLYLDQRFRKEGFDIDLIQHVQQRREQSGTGPS